MRLSDFRWLIAVCLFAACSTESPPDSAAPNQAPSVWVQAQPPIGSDNSYSMHFEWGGSDPDGKISHYEFLLRDNDGVMLDPAHVAGTWTTVYGDDSTFVFQIDPSHTTESGSTVATFLVRAVDNEMLASTEPDYISFSPKSLAPGVRITVPTANLGLTPATMPPVATFEWGENPPQPQPDSVQWAMVNTREHNDNYSQTIAYLRDPASAPDWYPWVWFDAPAGKGKTWTTPPLDFGDYVFAVRAKNVVGAMNPVLQEPVNVRRIQVLPPGEAGPTLVVQNPRYGYTIGAGCEFPLTIADMAAHVPISFTFGACADNYGGTVAGYRYGWDILDLDDPEQWGMDYTPFPTPTVTTAARRFSFGTHVFSVEVIDNLGSCSRIQVRINIVRFTGERDLLIVDDYRADEVPGQSGWNATNGAMPNDAEHDGFWLDMVSNVNQFDPAVDMIATSTDHVIPIATLSQYKNIVWSVFGDVDARIISDLPYLYTFIQYRVSRFPLNTSGSCSPTGGVNGQTRNQWTCTCHGVGRSRADYRQSPGAERGAALGTFVVRWPMIPLYELEPGATQTGTQPTYLLDRPGRNEFAYRDLCLDAIDFAYLNEPACAP